MFPEPWEFLLLTLAAYRVWRLIALDSLLDYPRSVIIGTPGWLPVASETPPAGYRPALAYWLTCPFCAGAWIAFSWWVAWIFLDEWAVAVAVPWALSAAVALVGSRLDPG